jgi:hypothetical protein
MITKAPSTKLQPPEKRQALTSNLGTAMRAVVWKLDIGISLELGTWNFNLWPTFTKKLISPSPSSSFTAEKFY